MGGGTGTGDGDLGQVGGPIETRGEMLSRLDPQASAQQELTPQQEAVGTMLDNFTKIVLDPIRAAVPGIEILRHDFTLKSRFGNRLTVQPQSIIDDGTLDGALVSGSYGLVHAAGKESARESFKFVLRRTSKDISIEELDPPTFQMPDQSKIAILEMVFAEVLEPIKAAQAEKESPRPDFTEGPSRGTHFGVRRPDETDFNQDDAIKPE